MIINEITALASGIQKEEMEDFDHYVYESAMVAVYGNGIWDWLNNRYKR